MGQTALYKVRPHYRGKSWIKPSLPRRAQDWTEDYGKSVAKETLKPERLIKVLEGLEEKKAWVWPKRIHYFFSDLHGDADAFAASMVAAGAVKKTGPSASDFELTEDGQNATFVIGGDCFDKGPSTLDLLDTLQVLKKKGAHMRLLAGNHDVRVFLGIQSVGLKHTVENEHFFIRTGQKIIPLLKEIWDRHLKGQKGLKGVPSKRKCRAHLYPRKSWFDNFAACADGRLAKAQVHRELGRIRKKYDSFEEKCRKQGLSLRHVYACVLKFRELFVDRNGTYSWFFRRVRLAYRAGSFLFVHAGLDNVMARQVSQKGIRAMNRAFKKALKGPAFDLYYGSLCNTLRTKYRAVDHPFGKAGANHVRRAGISAIVHGHRNLYFGQRLALRGTILHFECDTSLDRGTRKSEGVRGEYGASATILDPKGRLLGISSDYPAIKVFTPKGTLEALKNREKK